MIKRITISVPSAVAARIKRAAGEASVSSWVTSVVEERLNDEELDRLWAEFYASVSPTARDKRRAKAIHRRLVKRRRRGKVA